MRTFDNLYISGEWVSSKGGGAPIEVMKPRPSGARYIPEDTTADIDLAVRAP